MPNAKMILKTKPVIKMIGSYSSLVNSPLIPPKSESRIPIMITAVYLMNSTGIVKLEISPTMMPQRIPIRAQSMVVWGKGYGVLLAQNFLLLFLLERAGAKIRCAHLWEQRRLRPSFIYYLISTNSGNPKIYIFEIFFVNIQFNNSFF